ncbi:unnamed protein product [Kluyveromyces dobzhanskii CBS 2104]|uniref:WGS project CCBQ000000000 data, contig 00011 n=1 Tax=Kluyveromyces dobzhanskii CBS 2104 TaxID=1427455 RepID=A0A0A8LA16_9SACH|nr:unnamed protein product [Kluyveromyces dobzhanskii CBS 2104]
MPAKLRRKIPLDTRDVNTQSSKRMCLKNNSLLQELNKENVLIEIPNIDESPQSCSSSLTGFLNQHLEKQSPMGKPVSTMTEIGNSARALDSNNHDALTSSNLDELQDNLKDLERRLSIQNRDHFIKDAHYSNDDLTRCRNNFLFELECLPNCDWLQRGNLRTASYIPSVYQKLDPSWYFSSGFSVEDFANLPKSVKPYYILESKNEKSLVVHESNEPSRPENAYVQIENIEPLTKIIPTTKLKFRAKSSAFDEELNCQALFKQQNIDYNNFDDDDDLISLPDSLDYCKSVRKRFSGKRKPLSRHAILFFNDEKN